MRVHSRHWVVVRGEWVNPGKSPMLLLPACPVSGWWSSWGSHGLNPGLLTSKPTHSFLFLKSFQGKGAVTVELVLEEQNPSHFSLAWEVSLVTSCAAPPTCSCKESGESGAWVWVWKHRSVNPVDHGNGKNRIWSLHTVYSHLGRCGCAIISGHWRWFSFFFPYFSASSRFYITSMCYLHSC